MREGEDSGGVQHGRSAGGELQAASCSFLQDSRELTFWGASAVLVQMENDIKGAIKYIRQSEKHSRTSGFRDGVREAGEALDRLGKGNSR